MEEPRDDHLDVDVGSVVAEVHGQKARGPTAVAA